MLADIHRAKSRAFGDCVRSYHLMTPFCHARTRSRTLKRTVMMVEKSADMIARAANTLLYSAQPCAHCRYHPSPALTPTVSATINVMNDVPRPMNKPMKMLGMA